MIVVCIREIWVRGGFYKVAQLSLTELLSLLMSPLFQLRQSALVLWPEIGASGGFEGGDDLLYDFYCTYCVLSSPFPPMLQFHPMLQSYPHSYTTHHFLSLPVHYIN